MNCVRCSALGDDVADYRDCGFLGIYILQICVPCWNEFWRLILQEPAYQDYCRLNEVGQAMSSLLHWDEKGTNPQRAMEDADQLAFAKNQRRMDLWKLADDFCNARDVVTKHG